MKERYELIPTEKGPRIFRDTTTKQLFTDGMIGRSNPSIRQQSGQSGSVSQKQTGSTTEVVANLLVRGPQYQ